MEINQDHIDSLVRAPSESLNVEVKRWIDPGSTEGKEKIIKGCFALRNRNGGYLVIGFDNKTLQPNSEGRPENPRDVFHVDIIQGLISKYAQELFEVGVAFSQRDGTDFPVLVVPAGVQVPVAAKSRLSNSGGGALINEGDVYFRTLNTSGVPSTSRAHPKDWREILDICFDNREANIGQFLRRHLSGFDIKALMQGVAQSALIGSNTASLPMPSLHENAMALLTKGAKAFQDALLSYKNDARVDEMASGLTWQVAIVVDPELRSRSMDQDFLGEVLGVNPQYTGWPLWIDSRRFEDKSERPIREKGCWRALVVQSESWSSHLDFWQIESSQFYLRRALQDDLTVKVTPGTLLDPILVILRVAEAVAVGLTIIAKLSSGGETDSNPRRVGFAFKWSKLKSRRLDTWANRTVAMIGSPQTHVDDIDTYVEVPSDTPINAIAPFVDEATQELFASFDGERIPPHVIDYWVQKLINRQL